MNYFQSSVECFSLMSLVHNEMGSGGLSLKEGDFVVSH